MKASDSLYANFKVWSEEAKVLVFSYGYAIGPTPFLEEYPFSVELPCNLHLIIVNYIWSLFMESILFWYLLQLYYKP